jgi:hypothetical protein
VADHLQPLGVACRDDGQRRVGRDRVAGVHQLAAQLAAQGGLGQAGADGLGHLGHRDGTSKSRFEPSASVI